MTALALLAWWLALELAFIAAAWELGNEIEARAWARIAGARIGGRG